MQTTTNGRPVRPNLRLEPTRYQYQACDECFMISGWPANQDPLPACAYCWRAWMHPTPTHKSITFSTRFFWAGIGATVALTGLWLVSL